MSKLPRTGDAETPTALLRTWLGHATDEVGALAEMVAIFFTAI